MINVKIILNIRKITLFHQISKGLIFIQPVIVIVFLVMAVLLAETIMEYSVFISAASALILSIFNKGFTDKGIIPLLTSSLRNMIGYEYKFGQTREWLILVQKKRLKIRFTVTYGQKRENVYYVYFDKKNKEAIESLLHAHQLPVNVEIDR
ncbi:hypothetical protein [Alkalibacterium kapii]|uniref:Uncharacterized protein n=1 Tax=Alkalibacterium kapii TaxID=426704 RepID=A0A511AR28_9LACT|nr:hypothetical protein [Alkalibacterium kapii]GEK90655.1 hypothetical protein AKA01nite_02770 [Alkalibacterium kapii]